MLQNLHSKAFLYTPILHPGDDSLKQFYSLHANLNALERLQHDQSSYLEEDFQQESSYNLLYQYNK